MSTTNVDEHINVNGHIIKVVANGHNPRDGSRPIRVEVRLYKSTAVEVFEGPNAMSSAEDAVAGLCGEWKGKPKTMPWSHLQLRACS